MELAQPPELSSRASSGCSPTRSANARRGSRPRRAGSSRARRCGSCSASASACPADVRFTPGPHGKPELPGARAALQPLPLRRPRADRAGATASRSASTSSAPAASLARDRAHADRRRARDLRGDDRHTELLRIWCRKEALAKAIGGGLGWAPEAFDTSAPDGHALVDLELDEGYVGALAVAGDGTTVTQHRLAFDPSAP